MSAYKRLVNTTTAEQRERYVQVAAGLQAVDNLACSDYYYTAAERYIDGRCTSAQFADELVAYYSDKDSPKECALADLVSARISQLLDRSPAFTFSPAFLDFIHQFIFQDADADEYRPGKHRNYDVEKAERVLGGESVIYGFADAIDMTLAYDFEQQKNHHYTVPFDARQTHDLAKFVSGIWQIHPYCEGNTRTTAVFTILYLRSLGIEIDNKPFERNAKYFRDALVMANCDSVAAGRSSTSAYIDRFFSAILCVDKDIVLESVPSVYEQ